MSRRGLQQTMEWAPAEEPEEPRQYRLWSASFAHRLVRLWAFLRNGIDGGTIPGGPATFALVECLGRLARQVKFGPFAAEMLDVIASELVSANAVAVACGRHCSVADPETLHRLVQIARALRSLGDEVRAIAGLRTSSEIRRAQLCTAAATSA